MQRVPVSSSTIVSVGFDPASQTLEVEFMNGQIYQYFDVPEPYYQALISDSSPGTYLNQNIKGVFRYARS